jgi:outer membrane protein assembly factor BamE (lipoprotein component of BamABCDE complex)
MLHAYFHRYGPIVQIHFKGHFVKKAVLLAASAVAMLTISGCAVKSGNENLGKYEKQELNQRIVKGVTTKTEVQQLLGDPDKTDLESGMEKWTYTHVRKDAKAVNYIPVVSMFVAGTNDTIKTLVVLFDEKDVVKNYINSDAKGETKGGLFQ